MAIEPEPPQVDDPDRVGSYPAAVGAGGGYVWDAVLETRVPDNRLDVIREPAG